MIFPRITKDINIIVKGSPNTESAHNNRDTPDSDNWIIEEPTADPIQT